MQLRRFQQSTGLRERASDLKKKRKLPDPAAYKAGGFGLGSEPVLAKKRKPSQNQNSKQKYIENQQKQQKR